MNGLNGAVLFDFGGTLDADGLRWSVRFHDAYRADGGRIGIDEFEPLFRTSDRLLEALPDIRGLGFHTMIETQAAVLCPLVPDGALIDSRRLARRVHADAVRVIERNRSVLERIRRHYRLGVVSNFTGNLEVCLAELGIRDLFDAVTDSAVLGTAKPHPKPFTHTLAAIGVSAAHAWVVGDNFDSDIRPAHDLGMRTVWLATPDRAAPIGTIPPPPTARITSLTELEDLVRLVPAHAFGSSPCTA